MKNPIEQPEIEASDGAGEHRRSIAHSFHVWGAGTITSSQWEPESMRVGAHLHYITAGDFRNRLQRTVQELS